MNPNNTYKLENYIYIRYKNNQYCIYLDVTNEMYKKNKIK